MKIKIDSARDGGTIYLDGVKVGYLEHYRGDATYVRFANQDDAPYMAYDTTDAVARIKYQGYAAAKKWAKEALIAAGGDFKKLAARGKGGVWGTDLLETFTLSESMQRMVDDRCRSVAFMDAKLKEKAEEVRNLKAAIEVMAA